MWVEKSYATSGKSDFGLQIADLQIGKSEICNLKSEMGLMYVSNWKNAHCCPKRGEGLL